MSATVTAHPSVPLIDHGHPKGSAVVVAPWLDNWVAWIKVPFGWIILERTQRRQHAIDDGRTYAGRFGLPLTIRDEPMPLGFDRGAYVPVPNPPRGGEIYITTDDHDGGCWAVMHEGAHGDHGALISRHIGFDQAVAAARDAAALYGARFDDEPDTGGTAA